MNNFYKKGTSLFEFVIYIAIVSVVLIFVINILVLSSTTLRDAKMSKQIRTSADVIITRIVNETRKASTVDVNNSVFGENSGKIVLNVKGGDSNKEIQIFLDSGKVKIYKGGVYIGDLSADNVFVESLIFRNINNEHSNAIKLEMNIKNSQVNPRKSENFYMTIVLRGSYVQ